MTGEKVALHCWLVNGCAYSLLPYMHVHLITDWLQVKYNIMSSTVIAKMTETNFTCINHTHILTIKTIYV